MDPTSTTLKQRILSLFFSKPRHRLNLKEIHKALESEGQRNTGVLLAIKELTKEGTLVRLKKDHYALPRGQNIVVGKVQGHPDGFGFLIPEESGVEDVYLNRREMRRVMHGDRIVVRIQKKKRGAHEAHIVQILECGQSRLIGTYQSLYGRKAIVPMEPRMGLPLQLKGEIPALGEGDVIAAEIVRYGTSLSRPEATLIEVLGDPDHPEVQAKAVIFRYGLPTVFSPESQRQVNSCPSAIGPAGLASRMDLRWLPTVTIDGEQARDFDDSVSVQRKKDHYLLYISIADVAHYVAPGTPLDQEAYERGTSVYFPDRAIPMLPEVLSNGICSLNPDVDRLTKTALLEFNSKGEVVNAEFFSSIIHSRKRLTYTQVARILVEKDPQESESCKDLLDQLHLMEELASILLETRRERGNLDFDLPEAEIVLDLQGTPENIIRSERNIAHRIIEEFMIAANEAVARHLTQRGIPILYRIHEEPKRDTLEAVAPFLLTLEYHLPLGRGETSPKDIQKILESCQGKPEGRVLNRILLRSMKKACYAPKNSGHFGLASTCYTHFTSPIRRYPDLLVHRALEQAIAGTILKPKEKDDLTHELVETGRHTSERERIATNAEREMVDLKKAQFMMDKIDQEFAGWIVDLVPFGFFVELDTFFVEGLVPMKSLLDDSYNYYEKEHIIKGRRHGRTFRIGDVVQIRLKRIHAFRGELEYELLRNK